MKKIISSGRFIYTNSDFGLFLPILSLNVAYNKLSKSFAILGWWDTRYIFA
jgi:hypothetical protein